MWQEQWDDQLDVVWSNEIDPAISELQNALKALEKAHQKTEAAQENIENVETKLTACDAGMCPLGIDHPPTGIEFCLGNLSELATCIHFVWYLGCSMCEAEGKKQSEDPDGLKIPEHVSQQKKAHEAEVYHSS